MRTHTMRAGLAPCLLGGLLLTAAVSSSAAVIEVNTLVDEDSNDGWCSLRQAIISANGDSTTGDCTAGSGLDTIEFAVTGTIVLVADMPEISKSLVIEGPGVTQLTIDGASTHQIIAFDSGDPGAILTVRGVRLFRGGGAPGGAVRVEADETVVLEDVNIQQSTSSSGGAVYADDAALVRLTRCGLRKNQANMGGGLYIAGGDLIVEDSTIALNEATGNQGGGLYLNTAGFTIRRSTFSANKAAGDGGGMALVNGTGTVNSSTFTLNVADTDANGNDGGGIYLQALSSLTIKNSIVAQNDDGSAPFHHDFRKDAASGATVTSNEFNFVGVNLSVENDFDILNHDQEGTVAAPLSPSLGALAANGGPTNTHLPQTGSLVVDAGQCDAATRDQRGYKNAATGFRVVDDPGAPNVAVKPCDIGAVEVGATP